MLKYPKPNKGSLMQKLPIGIQTFKEIREDNYIYIDKTKMALDIINNYKYVFLSRPRRFGKSLFLDTLRNIFEGKKELFENLYIYDKWDFKEYPVIKISWGGGSYANIEKTHKKALFVLENNQTKLGVECKIDDTPSVCFDRLIQEAYKKYNQRVVVLIDEYDKPILNNISNPKIALQNRDFLREFYEILKENDEYIKFAFLTGISKFSRASIFSGLNNIVDISLMSRFGNICGYTQKDLDTSFKEYFDGIDMKRVQEWYNGYNFLGDSVYNPFDILKFIKNDFMFDNYWWESGNPNFLIQMLQKGNYYIPSLENITVGKELLSSFDIERLRLEVLLFQAGYLTIDKMIQKRTRIEYKLKIPNLEIQSSLNILFIDYLTDSIEYEKLDSIYETLQNQDLDSFKEVIESLFASIAYNNYTKNSIGEYEGYYASVLYAYLAGSGLNIVAEDVTSIGRMDLAIIFRDSVYILEFKVNGSNALNQIKDKDYASKYKSRYTDIYLIGIEFDSQSRNIANFEWERLK